MKTIRLIPRALAGLAVILLAFTSSAQVFINEICADNDTAFNNDGDFPDYVELFNTSNAPVNIAAWRLSINTSQASNPEFTYIFPANTIVPARGFLMVICDGQTNQRLHTAFNLGRNGETVTLLGPSFGLRDGVRFGFQVSDHSLARIPDGSGTWALCRPTAGALNVQVPLGNRQRLRINEWMPSRGGEKDWFEIYNPEPNPISLSLLVFSDRTNILTQCTNKATMTNSFMAAKGFLQFFCDQHGERGNDELDFNMTASLESVTIFSQNRSNFFHRVWWTNAVVNVAEGLLPDGDTNSRVTFPVNRDTPGESNFLPIDNVLINEVISHSDPPLEDAVELYNPTASPVDISGWWLSDDRDEYNKFRIPPNTILQPFGYMVFYEYKFEPGGFNPNGVAIFPSFAFSSSAGDDAYLFATDATGKLTGYRRGVDFPAMANGTSYGRYITSTGESDFIPLERLTFGSDVVRTDPTNRLDDFRAGMGAPNSGPKLGPLVINEIMYHPPDIISGTNVFDNELDEYVEIYNVSLQTVNMWHPLIRTNTWRLRGEIDFDFPTNTSLGAGRSLVVVNFGLTNTIQLNTFRAKYNVPPGVQILGAYRGKLSNGNGTVEIEEPDLPQPNGFIPYLRIDRVRYDDDPPWPTDADGVRINPSLPNSLGYVLARKKPERYGGDPTNWVAAIPSAGRQLISNTVNQADGVVTVRFEGLAGSGYTVLYRDVLESGTWIKLQDMPPQTTSGPRETIAYPAPGTRRFYKVVTPIQ